MVLKVAVPQNVSTADSIQIFTTKAQRKTIFLCTLTEYFYDLWTPTFFTVILRHILHIT